MSSNSRIFCKNVNTLDMQCTLKFNFSAPQVTNSVAPHKDVDGFHTLNVGCLCVDEKAFIPATPAGIMEIIRRTGNATFLEKIYPYLPSRAQDT